MTEAQSWRKLRDDLLALHHCVRITKSVEACAVCGVVFPCPTVRMIEEADRG